MAEKVDKKKDAIFRMEEVGGKLFRVMYFKNYKGGLTRSKFIREVEPKVKGKRGRLKNVPVQEEQPTDPVHKFVKPSGAAQNIINEWASRTR